MEYLIETKDLKSGEVLEILFSTANDVMSINGNSVQRIEELEERDALVFGLMDPGVGQAQAYRLYHVRNDFLPEKYRGIYADHQRVRERGLIKDTKEDNPNPNWKKAFVTYGILMAMPIPLLSWVWLGLGLRDAFRLGWPRGLVGFGIQIGLSYALRIALVLVMMQS